MSTKRAPPGSPGRGVAGLELELAAHPPRQLGADRQAEAEAGRGRVLAALEALEDRVALGVGDAGAAVEDADLYVAVDRLGAHLDRRRRARSGGVVDQQAHDPGDALGVARGPAVAPPARSSAGDRTPPRPRARARRARSARCAARARVEPERSSRPLLRPLRRWACSERLLDVLLDALGVGLVDGQLEQVLQRRRAASAARARRWRRTCAARPPAARAAAAGRRRRGRARPARRGRCRPRRARAPGRRRASRC